ncbi:hypothetical protein M4449_08200 [Staphylococcus warneri]|nr:hypothetical protein [Staphylococcus warneri]
MIVELLRDALAALERLIEKLDDVDEAPLDEADDELDDELLELLELEPPEVLAASS